MCNVLDDEWTGVSERHGKGSCSVQGDDLVLRFLQLLVLRSGRAASQGKLKCKSCLNIPKTAGAGEELNGQVVACTSEESNKEIEEDVLVCLDRLIIQIIRHNSV